MSEENGIPVLPFIDFKYQQISRYIKKLITSE
jgi:hypothetical protein